MDDRNKFEEITTDMKGVKFRNYNFNNKFKNLKMKYKSDPKKYIVIFTVLCQIVGVSPKTDKEI